MNSKTPSSISHLAEDFEDFFDNSICGFIITDAESNIQRINKTAAKWLNGLPDEFRNKRFSDLLAVGGKIYFETHLWPLLRMQGHFDEVTVELANTGNGKMPIYLNGLERKTNTGQPVFMRFVLFRATDRRLYEQNLQMAKQVAESELSGEKQNAVIREQFIAVLGHDLRNPLGAIMSAAQMLARTALAKNEERLVKVLQTSSKRMHEMIDNIMDLARGRLGSGITINPTTVDLDDLLKEVAEELKLAWPERIIEFNFDIEVGVNCDRGRIAQLTSNLLANALTHGSKDAPVLLKAVSNDSYWEISISNQGKPIPEHSFANLFHPFHRQNAHSSQNGLGLGLYIASEIAKAHQGQITVLSNEQITSFTFKVIVD